MRWLSFVPWWLVAAAVLLIFLSIEGLVSRRALGICALVGGLLFGGYQWGATTMNRAWQAKEDKRLQDEAGAREAEWRRSEKAGGAVGIELRQLAIDNDQLTKAFNDYKRKHPLVVRIPQRATPALAGASAPERADAAQAPLGDASADAYGIALTRGAVWMWNSALYQRDTPAGACGLADSSEGACAAGAGLTLEDAWDNQAVNARICAEDRVRHQALIDFIKGKKK